MPPDPPSPPSSTALLHHLDSALFGGSSLACGLNRVQIVHIEPFYLPSAPNRPRSSILSLPQLKATTHRPSPHHPSAQIPTEIFKIAKSRPMPLRVLDLGFNQLTTTEVAELGDEDEEYRQATIPLPHLWLPQRAQMGQQGCHQGTQRIGFVDSYSRCRTLSRHVQEGRDQELRGERRRRLPHQVIDEALLLNILHHVDSLDRIRRPGSVLPRTSGFGSIFMPARRLHHPPPHRVLPRALCSRILCPSCSRIACPARGCSTRRHACQNLARHCLVRVLNGWSCVLAEIPMRAKLRSLEVLYLSNNRIDAMPDELFNLTTLRQLWLAANVITEVML